MGVVVPSTSSKTTLTRAKSIDATPVTWPEIVAECTLVRGRQARNCGQPHCSYNAESSRTYFEIAEWLESGDRHTRRTSGECRVGRGSNHLRPPQSRLPDRFVDECEKARGRRECIGLRPRRASVRY